MSTILCQFIQNLATVFMVTLGIMGGDRAALTSDNWLASSVTQMRVDRYETEEKLLARLWPSHA